MKVHPPKHSDGHMTTDKPVMKICFWENLVWVDQNWQPKVGPSPAINGLRARAAFMSIVEANGFSNRQHWQGAVSEREQQAHDVLKKAYTHSWEQ